MRDATHAPRPDGLKRVVERIILALMFAIPLALIALA